MLTFVLASFLAAPPAGEPCPVILRPAVVVQAEESVTDNAAEAEAPRASQDQDVPRLAPAQTVPPKAKLRPRKKR